ncbi:MAG: GAF domain-containing protein [Myxococcales bacterium]|nr:GAF domain-containing protein [Myxococcales bacterium]
MKDCAAKTGAPRGESLLGALTEVAARVQQARTVSQVLDTAGRGLLELGMKLGVARLEAERVVVVWAPELPELERLLGRRLIGMGGPMIPGVGAQTLDTKRPVYCPDLAVWAQWVWESLKLDPALVAGALASAGCERCLISPLEVRGRPWGFVGVVAADITEDDAPALSLFAAQVGSALEVADALEELRGRDRELEAIRAVAASGHSESQRRVRQLSLMLDLTRIATETKEVATLVDRALVRVVEALPADIAMLHLLEEGRLQRAGIRTSAEVKGLVLEPALQSPPLDGSTLISRSANERRTMIAAAEQLPETVRPVANRHGIRFVLATPLVRGDGLLGTLSVARADERRFSDEEVQLVESCAAQLGAAVEHARLFEEERRRVCDLSAINELGALIAQHLELSAVMSTAVRQLSRIAEVPNVFLVLLDETGTFLRMAATNVDHPAAKSFRLEMSEPSAAAEAVRRRAPVAIEDVRADPRVSRRLANSFGHRALLAVPLVADGRALGAMVLGETREGRRFSQGEVDRTLAVANQVAAAVANAQLYDDLKRSYDQLERAQDQLVRHERLAALGELAAVMAHEVRNPLGVIFNSLGSLRKILKPSGDAELLLRIVGEEADRLNRIVGELLDFVRPYDAQLRPVEVSSAIASAVETAVAAVAAGGVEIHTEVPPGLPPVGADSDMLRQALVNLIINAIQAMPKRGRVTVCAKGPEPEGARVMRVEVSDEGVGIPPQHLGRIFEPFFTTKASGTGLGLAVVKRIIDAHGGEIEVRSASGSGTTFTVRLPLAEA